jgi:hypothetical protein
LRGRGLCRYGHGVTTARRTARKIAPIGSTRTLNLPKDMR